jgi:putative DNA primase/helicase
VNNGVIDLRTGKLRAGQTSDRITLHANVDFDPLAKCNLWLKFLDDIFRSNSELIALIQRGLGYSLTGDTREQCAFLCWGHGSNGKSTFLEVLRRVFGSYAHNLPFSAFELNARASIPNDMASLVGKRFVTAIETSESVRLNEARIKALTGEDSITARFLHKEFFTFRPIGKVWLAFNHKPSVEDDSHGFWRRVRLIPFLASFKGDSIDDQLVSKLSSEGQGILAWGVRGCQAWRIQGLGLPASVREATEAYRVESDPLRDFIADCCVLNEDAQIEVRLLWLCYCDWAKNSAIRPLNRRQFTERVVRLGAKRSRMGHDRTWTWLGICRIADAEMQNIVPVPDLRTDADANIH